MEQEWIKGRQVLLVDDEPELAVTLGDYLEALGAQVDFAYDGRQCLARLEEQAFDAIVLDVRMPGLDGLQTCRRLRSLLGLSTPVLFLTARDTLDDTVEGFEAGGDDYLVKPYAMSELLCRLRALMVRGPRRDFVSRSLGRLRLDHENFTLIGDDQRLTLHRLTFRLLCLLGETPGQPVSREHLLSRLWPDGSTEATDPLRTQVYRLRHALQRLDAGVRIETLYGRGYRLVID